jgi:hypothetical protein
MEGELAREGVEKAALEKGRMTFMCRVGGG